MGASGVANAPSWSCAPPLLGVRSSSAVGEIRHLRLTRTVPVAVSTAVICFAAKGMVSK